MDLTQAIRNQFANAASDYTVSPVHRAGPDLDAMLAAGLACGARRVLDVGCGTGHTALAFAASGAEVVALDLTPEMLAQGRRLASDRGLTGVTFREGDVADLPFPDERFDLVTSRFSAHHYTRPEAALGEVARVLAPGGTLLLVDAVAPEDAAQDTFLNAIEVVRDASHVRDHSASQWCGMLEEAGYAPEVLETWQIEIDFDDWVARMSTPAPAVAQLRAMLGEAVDEMRRAFSIRSDHGFHIPAALLCGRREVSRRVRAR